MLIDEAGGTHTAPTCANIKKAIEELVRTAAAGDLIFFSYSGHGSCQPDRNGDEADGRDETICPLDRDSAGDIVDDWIGQVCEQRRAHLHTHLHTRTPDSHPHSSLSQIHVQP